MYPSDDKGTFWSVLCWVIRLYHRHHRNGISVFAMGALLLQIPLGNSPRKTFLALYTGKFEEECSQDSLCLGWGGCLPEWCSRLGRRQLGCEVRGDAQGPTSVSSALCQSLPVSSGFQCVSYLICKFLTWEAVTLSLGDWLRAATVPHPICVMFLVGILFYLFFYSSLNLSTCGDSWSHHPNQDT